MALFGKKRKDDTGKEEKSSGGSSYVDPATGQVIGKPKAEKKSSRKLKKDTGFAYRALIRPVISEKATDLTAENQYVFEVSKNAGKRMIKTAVEKVYDTKVKSVNVMNVQGKTRRRGATTGRTKHWKKAVVTLEEGQKIEIFEGV